MYIHTFDYMRAQTCTHTYTHMYICVHTHINLHESTNMHMHMHTHVHTAHRFICHYFVEGQAGEGTQIDILTFNYMRAQTCTCTCTHTFTPHTGSSATTLWKAEQGREPKSNPVPLQTQMV